MSWLNIFKLYQQSDQYSPNVGKKIFTQLFLPSVFTVNRETAMTEWDKQILIKNNLTSLARARTQKAALSYMRRENNVGAFFVRI